jgi:flagellar protein FlaF
MAVAEIIGAAVGVLLLIIVAYVVVGSTLTAAETVSFAQKDLTQLSEARLKTSIALNKTEANLSGQGLNFSVVNNGNEIISDFSHMDILLSTGGGIRRIPACDVRQQHMWETSNLVRLW